MANLNNIIRIGFAVLAIGAGAYICLGNHVPDEPESPEAKSPIVKSESNANNEKKKEVKYPASTVPVSEITASLKGKKRSVAGTIVSVTSGKGHHFYMIQDIISSDQLKIVIFNASEHQDVDSALKSSLDHKSLIKVSGKVDVYKGENEIIAESAEKL